MDSENGETSVGVADLTTQSNDRIQNDVENNVVTRQAIVTEDVTRIEDALSTLKRKIERMESSNLTENEKNIIINLMKGFGQDQVLNIIQDSPDSTIISNVSNEFDIRSTQPASTFIGSTDHHDEENFIPDDPKEHETEDTQSVDDNNDGGTVQAIPVDDNIVVATCWNNNPGETSGKNDDGFFPTSRKARIGLLTIVCVLMVIIITLLALLVFGKNDLYPESQIQGIQTNHTLPPRNDYHNTGGLTGKSGDKHGNNDNETYGDFETINDSLDMGNKIIESFASDIYVGSDDDLN